MDSKADVSLKWLIIPAIVTLAITLIRLWGELQGGDPSLFANHAGGATLPPDAVPKEGEPGPHPALIGIFWLMPLVGVYAAIRLRGLGDQPLHRGVALLRPLLFALPMMVVLGGTTIIFKGERSMGFLFVLGAAEIVGLFCASRAGKAWPSLFRLMFWYGVFARLPIVILTIVLVPLDKGTHYEKLAPFAPADLPDWVTTLVLCSAQIGLWIPLTVFLGMMAGAVTTLVMGRTTSD